MNIKIIGTALFALTLGTVLYYPQLQAKSVNATPQFDAQIEHHITAHRPVVDVVFVLDTTGSMSGLIQTAKEKIWSIASTMASAQQTPDIRIGLVGYRDRGDAYVTKVVDLNDDLDSVYATLMDFQAGGGGDSPESVNKALYDAVYAMSWSKADQAYQTIFLVGDAPPHMDYNEVQYPAIVAAANERGIVINTIQAGNIPSTIQPWTAIASLGHGNFFQVDQAGGAVAYESPFDKEIATLAAELDATRLYYGSEQEKKLMDDKVAATEKVNAMASVAARARRGTFNAGDAGRENLLGDNELVDAIASGAVELEEIETDELPAALKPMPREEQVAYVARLAEERADIQHKIRSLAEDRDEFIAKKVEEAGGLHDSLDQKLYETVKEQAGKSGLDYRDGPAY
ncbi:MAG: vWA domain-containing protein [Woeseiaceae bacterium]